MSGARRFSYPAAREGETVEERLLAEGYSKRLIVLLKQLPEGLTVAGSGSAQPARCIREKSLPSLCPSIRPGCTVSASGFRSSMRMRT